MSDKEIYYKEIESLFQYDDLSYLQKRLIDFTLDTEDIQYYKQMLNLIEDAENEKENNESIKNKYQTYFDTLKTVLDRKEIKKENSHLLEVSNLSKRYQKSPFSLGPINLNINAGEIIGLVGENGNGKTTLLRILCGELLKDQGEIKYNFDYKDLYDLRSKLIYIPQRTKDWYGSLLDNLRFTAASYGIKGEENTTLVELIIARIGLRKYRTFDWKRLSSGYKMRFELARMLLRKPKLLLIDEPLANLDIVAQQVVLEDFRNIAKSPFRPLGIILSSQQLYEVEKTSDQVIFLKNGKPNKQYANADQTQPSQEEQFENKLIIEFETSNKQEQLKEYFAPIQLEKIFIEGGTYITIFPKNILLEDFLQIVLEQKISITYFRNISDSSRRYFISK